jgi:hypothetical protein
MIRYWKVRHWARVFAVTAGDVVLLLAALAMLFAPLWYPMP